MVAFINPIISTLFGDVYLEGKQIIVFMLLMQVVVFISSLIAYICLSLYKIQDFNHKVINIVGETKIVVFDKTGTLTETT